MFAPIVTSELKHQLNESHCVTIFTDASNHGSRKIFPILVRFFLPYEGTQVELIEFRDQPGETSDVIVNYIMKVLADNNLTSKIVAFCGDNTNCNFGGLKRRGVNNVYAKLNLSLGRTLIGIGCGAHIIHNAIKTAADCQPVDLECVLVKIYSHFYIYSVRVESLKEFCDKVDTEYQQLLGYSKTRWLALMPAIERVIKLYIPLKNYFLSIEKCPNILKLFFENPSSELWLLFMHSQAATFHQAVLNIEGQCISAIDTKKEIDKLLDNLALKEKELFLPHSMRNVIKKLKEDGCDIDEDFIKATAVNFYKTSREYLHQWTLFYDELKIYEWANLRQVPTWTEIQRVTDVLFENGFLNANKDAEIFDEFALVCKYTAQKVANWNELNISTESRWIELFKHFRDNNLMHANFRIISEFILCLPGSNAPVERVFTAMNKLWTTEKAYLKVTALKAILMTKINCNKTCVDFYSFLKCSPQILKQICSSEKYN